MTPTALATTPAPTAPPFRMTADLEAAIDEVITHYPQRRSAALMVLHALQEHFGYLGQESIEWAAAKLALQPIHILELVTFYPLFRSQPAGQQHFRICRTLSCALGGSHALHAYLCDKLGLDRDVHGPQSTGDGRFTVEFVECLANCHAAPTLMVNDHLWEGVTPDQLAAIFSRCPS